MNQQPTIKDVMDALKNAEATGKKQEAQRLAVIADKMVKQAPQQEAKAGITTSMAMGIEQTPLGFPTKILRDYGVLPKLEGTPSRLPEAIGAGIGETAGMLLPAGFGARAIAAGTGIAGKIAGNIMSTMAKHPWITMASEAGGGVGLGGGRVIGEEISDEPGVQAMAEMGGGMLGSMAPGAVAYTPTMLAIKGGRGLLRKISFPFTERGATGRAETFLQKQAASPLKASEMAVAPTIGDLPPAVATGEKRLISLYQTLASKDPAKEAQVVKDISDSFVKLHQEMNNLGYGSPEALKEVLQKRIAAIELGIDNRVMQAMDRAQNKLNALPIADRKVAESRIVRQELENLMKAEKVIEQDLWRKVEKNMQVGLDSSKKVYTDILDNLSEAQKVDIPTALKIKGNIITGEDNITTLKEMQGMRSKLLEEARIARSKGQWNKARVAGEVADGIITDLEIAGAMTEDAPLKSALAGTRRFKERFEQGTTGKILGFSSEGPPTVSPDITLDISIGRAGAKGAVDFEKVVVTPDALNATKRYLARSYTDYALDRNTGLINPIKSDKWVRNNEAVLDKIPGLRNTFMDVGESQKLANSTATMMDARKRALQNPKISVASKFLGMDVNKEVDTILKSKDPAGLTEQLVRMARKDKKGGSLEGIRGAYIDNILQKSMLGGYNDFGDKTLSGRAMLHYLNQNNRVLKATFDDTQIERMYKIAKELSYAEMFGQTFKGEIEVSDPVSNLLKTGARVAGAAMGRHWGSMVGAKGTVQIPGIFAQRYYQIANYLSKNRFENLVSDAILQKDGKLLHTLLLPIDKSGFITDMNLKTINQRLNAWGMAEGRRVAQDIEEEFRADREGREMIIRRPILEESKIRPEAQLPGR